MSVKTVKVGNLSLNASPREVREFFSFSGDIVYVEVQSNEDNHSQNAFVTFTESQGAETAVLLSGATIVDMAVTVTLAQDYQLPLDATSAPRGENLPEENDSVIRKAEDVMTNMFSKAKQFDEKIGFTEKVTTGTSMVNEKVKELQVSEKAKLAYAAAEDAVSSAGSALMKNRYVLTSASWVTGAFNKVAKSASEAGQPTTKVDMSEGVQKDKVVDDVAPSQQQQQQQELSPPPSSKTPEVQGLIL
ncbi:hypothetical protein LXL04_005459 [Taraxacum kok-saghyz]